MRKFIIFAIIIILALMISGCGGLTGPGSDTAGALPADGECAVPINEGRQVTDPLLKAIAEADSSF